MHLVLLLDQRSQHKPFVDKYIISTPMRFPEKPKRGLIDSVDNPVAWDARLAVAQSRKGAEKIRYVSDIFNTCPFLNHPGPADKGIYTNAALQMLGLAAAIDPVGLAALVDELHERAIVSHDHDDRIVCYSQFLDPGQDFTDVTIDLDDSFCDRSTV